MRFAVPAVGPERVVGDEGKGTFLPNPGIFDAPLSILVAIPAVLDAISANPDAMPGYSCSLSACARSVSSSALYGVVTTDTSRRLEKLVPRLMSRR